MNFLDKVYVASGITRKRSKDFQCMATFPHLCQQHGNESSAKAKTTSQFTLAVSPLALTPVNSLVCILPDLFYAFT